MSRTGSPMVWPHARSCVAGNVCRARRGGAAHRRLTITAHTLIIWGARDGLLTRAKEDALAAAIPVSRLVVYEDTGHLVLWEQPHRLAIDVAAFVAGLPD